MKKAGSNIQGNLIPHRANIVNRKHDLSIRPWKNYCITNFFEEAVVFAFMKLKDPFRLHISPKRIEKLAFNSCV